MKVYAHIIKQHAAGVADTFAAAADVIRGQGEDGDEDDPEAASLVPC